MERFLSTFNFNKLISESTTKSSIGGNSQGVDDGLVLHMVIQNHIKLVMKPRRLG